MKKRTISNKDKKGKKPFKAWCYKMSENFLRIAKNTEKYRAEFSESITFFTQKANYYKKLGDRARN